MKKMAKLFGIIVMVAVIGFSMAACDNGGGGSGGGTGTGGGSGSGGGTHTHQWGEWIVTTTPTEAEDGVETRVCDLDSSHKETNVIPKGIAITEGGTTLASQLAWLDTNAVAGKTYRIEVKANETLAPQTLEYTGKINITVNLVGIGGDWIISLSGNGSLFTVKNGQTLTLSNITLKGHSSNDSALVSVTSSYGSTLIMNNGAKITGNTNTNDSSSNGGGVYINYGKLTMNGGEISGNKTNGSYISRGGGVFASNGSFEMNGGIITGNTAQRGTTLQQGGGVYIPSTGLSFTQNGGTISGNTPDNIYDASNP